MSFCCSFCSYTSNKKFNVIRHQNKVHSSHFSDEISEVSDNDDLFTPLNNDDIEDENKCIKCNKTFIHKGAMNKHTKTCDGSENKLQCTTCNKIFSSVQSKNRHMVNCRTHDTNVPSGVPINSDPNTIIPTVQNTINGNSNSVSTNINTTNSNNITNNIVNHNIMITFDRHSQDKTEFIKDHINIEILKKLLNDSVINGVNDGVQMLLSDYFRVICNNTLNRCISKPNKNLKTSKVHVGNGEWQSISDNLIFPKLLQDISKNLKEDIDENDDELRKKFKKQLSHHFTKIVEIIDTLSYDLDDESEADKEYKKLSKNAEQDVKCVVVDYTATKAK